MIATRSGVARRARLAAVGAYVPERVVTNAAVERMVDTSDECIVARTGSRERRWAPPEQASPDLGLEAPRRALEAAGPDPADPDAEDLMIPAGGGRMPRAAANSPSDGFVKMNGAEAFRFATRAIVESTGRILDALGVDLEDIDLVVAHRANQRIIDSAASRLGIPEDKLFNNLEHYGNTSSASIPIALAEARDVDRLRPDDLVLAGGFGAGLTWGSMVARYEPMGVGA